LFELLAYRQRQPVLGSNVMNGPLAQDQRNQMFGPLELVGQCARSGEGLGDICRRPAFRGSQCRSERDL
jgi:hypothetical protein